MNLKALKNPTIQRLIIYPLVLILILYILWPQIEHKYYDSGFDLADSLIDAREIFHGGPAKDGIPSLDHPQFLPIDSVTYLQAKDRVLGLSLNGVHKAYPVKILDHHEIVNDTFLKQAVVVSYCPLCGTGMAFDANIKGETLEFGVSGLLYNSDVLLYDRNTNSLWSQILSKSISGRLKGQDLKLLSLENTNWQTWENKFPDTLVLSEKTGFNRNYNQSPYVGYENNSEIYFPIKNLDKRYHPKQPVLGLKIGQKQKVYPFSELSKGKGVITDIINKVPVTIQFDSKNKTATVFDSKGNIIPSTVGYWFAWMAFYPDSILYNSEEEL